MLALARLGLLRLLKFSLKEFFLKVVLVFTFAALGRLLLGEPDLCESREVVKIGVNKAS